MQTFLVIAHRGASGYLPEHTLEAAVLAHAMGADYIEQDTVLTADDVPVVLHDLWLEAVSDVAERFAGRQRADGHFYAIDFTWAEIRSLRAHERVNADGSAAFPGRFPTESDLFRIPSLDETIRLIHGLNRSTGREAGVYIEPKAPAFHAAAGKDAMAAVIGLLASHGLTARYHGACVQSFDTDALRRARHELGCDLNLVQLIGDNAWGESAADFDAMRTPAGLAAVAAYADGIGPWLPQVVATDAAGRVWPSGLVDAAHQLGLFVHAYTLQADRLPESMPDLSGVVAFLAEQVRLDGVFTDHPDRVREALVPGFSG